eukprot:15165400-Alexandrium_andersonii.AAC.1
MEALSLPRGGSGSVACSVHTLSCFLGRYSMLGRVRLRRVAPELWRASLEPWRLLYCLGTLVPASYGWGVGASLALLSSASACGLAFIHLGWVIGGVH